ncbi:MAG: hypothetical protein KKE20_06535 [Nanoarchaeota archaeon]|nr:hypothetical protein [Nanoarchaeota archaeon]
MTGKKAMELSVNFIVTFIMAIVLFGMGLMFARSIMSGGTELTEEAYDQMSQQIDSLVCSRGESVCISTNNKEIERKQIAVFPITIKNELPDRQDFRVTVELARAWNLENDELYSEGQALPVISWLPQQDTTPLDPGESITLPVIVKAEKDSLLGKYSFSIYFESSEPGADDWEPYPDERPNKFYVNIR